MPDLSKRDEAQRVMARLVERMRDDSLDAILASNAVPNAKLVISVPRSDNRPVDASIIAGGLQMSLFETREIA